MSSSERGSGSEPLNELAPALEVVGMTNGQTQVYLRLLQAGPTKVRHLAPYCEASRSTLYRLLDELNQKGFVSKTPERPTVYHPVIPREAFEIGRQKLDRRSKQLEAVREKLLPSLERLHRPSGGPEPPDWTKIEGKEQIYELVQRLVGEAEESLWVVSNRDPSESAWLPLVRETWTLVEQRVREEEIGARFLLSPNESEMKHVPDRVVEGASRLRALDGDESVRFTVIDEETVVFWIETAPDRGLLGRESVAVHTDAEGPVSTHIALFERLWEDASSPR